MLRLPDLDNKTYEQLLEESKKLIQAFSPVWTDFNAHDPGITIIELFAWLVEMQQYYLNTITEKHYIKFLQLLGITLTEPVYASTKIEFSIKNSNKESTLVVPGTMVCCGDIIYETTEAVEILAGRIAKIVTSLRAGFIDNTWVNSHPGICYFPFGESPSEGDVFYIGLECYGTLERGATVSLYIDILDTYVNNPVNDGQEQIEPPAEMLWEYMGSDGKWLDIEVVKDGTNFFTKPGKIVFCVPGDWNLKTPDINLSDKDYYWIRSRIIRGSYEMPPKISTVVVNSADAVQKETIIDMLEFSGNGAEGQVFELTSYASNLGTSVVQVRDESGCWKYWNQVKDIGKCEPGSAVYSIARKSFPAQLLFGNKNHGKPVQMGLKNIRVISFGHACKKKDEQHGDDSLSTIPGFYGNGLPSQVFCLDEKDIISKSFILQVGETETEDGHRWYDWSRVDNLDASTPCDRHYVLNTGDGTIEFGDGVNGKVCPGLRGEENVRIISLAVGGGVKGNIGEGIISSIYPLKEDAKHKGKRLYDNIEIKNWKPCKGGTDRERLDTAVLRLRQQMSDTTRAITPEDYEEIALNTPGLCVAKAKALPLFKPGLKGYPGEKAEGSITIVAVPKSKNIKPMPGEAFLNNVKRNLFKHRLITTEVHVVPPEYIEVSVEAVVFFKPSYVPDKEGVIKNLGAFLSPVGVEDGQDGWPFGRPVYVSEIYEVIEKTEGVDYVESVELNTRQIGISKDSFGNLIINPYSLVCSGNHLVEVYGPKNPAVNIKSKKPPPCEGDNNYFVNNYR